MNLKKLSNEELISLFKENDCSLTKIERTYNLSKDSVRRLFIKRKIDYNNIIISYKNSIINNYNLSPSLCKHCGKKLDWNHRKNKYCSESCAASENNRSRIRKPKIKEKIKKTKETKKFSAHKKESTAFCKTCGKEFTGNKDFCCEDCRIKNKKEEHYKDFLENNEKYCRSNYTPRNYIREKIFEEQNYTCALCPQGTTWNGKELHFVLDHIDGDASNNRRDNLRLICPNCDSQLPTFKSKNKNSTRRNYWKEKIYRDLGIEKP